MQQPGAPLPDHDPCFSVSASNLVFGPGATREVGDHAKELGLTRVLLVTDPRLRDGLAVTTALDSLREAGLEVEVHADIAVEPTDASFQRAAEVATEGRFDGYVAVGGGSAMDTAKAANLYATYPADFLAYVNGPIGAGTPPPGPLKPMIAVPTTSGTGSETTGTAIFDFKAMHAKTGIAHRRLRPTLGIVDPLNSHSMPAMVTASGGFDVLCHALESYTAIASTARPMPARPSLRPAYQGSNPFSDIWAEMAIRMVARSLAVAVEHPDDAEARAEMSLAATYAGIGFGNAGVHLPHGMSYAVAGQVRTFHPDGYPDDHAMVPHGMSVVLNAPAVFRYTASADPTRHLRAAELMGAEVRGAAPEDAGAILADAIVALMRRTGLPSGLAAVGYTAADAPALAEGTLPQHRVTKLSPRPAERGDLEALFRDALAYW
ncbi:MAG: hydroxyacid-oxoacid transhydrogenase [Chloroflexota bacterium]